MNGIDGYPQRSRPFPVHVDAVLSHIFHAIGAHTRQPVILGNHGEHLVARLHQFCMAYPATILQLKIESGRSAQLRDRRWGECKHPGVTDPGEARHGAIGQGFDFQLRPVAQFPILESHEPQARVLPAAGETSAGQRHHGFHDVTFVFEQIGADLFHDLFGLF